MSSIAHGETPTNIYSNPVAPFTWSNPANWSAAPPVGGSATTILQFNNSGATFYDANNDLTGTFQLNGLLLNSTSSRLSIISGNALNFTQDGSSNNPVLNQIGSSAFTINNAIVATDPLTIGGTGTGAIVLNGAITNTGGITVDNAGFTVYQGGAISGLGSLTKGGAGTLYLFGAGSFTGNVNINSGTLAIIGPGGTTDATSLGGNKTINIGSAATSGTFQILSGQYDPDLGTKVFSIGAAGGTIDIGLGGLFILNANAQLTGSGNLTKSGLGTFRMGSTFPGFTGNVLVSAGTLNVTNAGAIAGAAAVITVSSGATLDIGTTAALGYTKNITATGHGIDGLGAIVNSSTALTTLSGTISISSGTGIGGNGSGGITVGGAGTITGSGGLTKSGTNTVTLASNNSFTGATTIRGGTLALSTFAAVTDSRLDAASIVNLHGGTLSLLGSAGLSMTQTVNGVNVGIGSSAINVTSVTGQTTTFDPRGPSLTTNITRDKGGVVNFTLTAGGGTAVIGVNNANNVGGTLGGWALFGGNTWAINDTPNNKIAGLAAFATDNTFPAGGNVNLVASSAWTANSVNSLRFNAAAAITVNLTGTRSVASGGILVNSVVAANVPTISGGNLVTPDGANNDLVIVNNSTATMLISSVIGVTGNVTFGVTKSGPGALTFGATNLYTGGTFIVQGTGLANQARSFGALNTPVTIGQGATAAFRSDGAVNFDNDVIISPNALSATINFQQTTTASTNVTHRIRNLTVGSPTVGVQTLNFTQSSSYRLNVNGTTTLNGNAILSNAAQFVTLTGVVSDGAGSFSITKAGAGTLILTAANTFNGGVVITAGNVRAATSSVVTAGAVASGSLGTGTLLLAGGTLHDNDAARIFQNKLVINASSGFGSATTGSLTGSLTFNSALLTTPNTIDLITANPILTVSNTTTFNNVVTGASLTKAGSGTLIFGLDNLYTGSTTINAGVLRFETPGAIGGFGRNVTVVAGGTAAAGFAIDQAFIDRLTTTSAGVAALGVSSSSDLDLSLFPALRLGAAGIGTSTYSGVLTPNGTTYLLGGGGTSSPVTTPVLNITSQLTGGRSVNVGSNGTTAGVVLLANTANDYTGGNVITTGGILRTDVADGAAGSASVLGIVPTTPTNNITFTGGTFRFGTAATTLNANRSIVLGAGGGGFDTNGFNFTLTNALSGTGGFRKLGAGTLNLDTNIPDTNILSVNGGTLDLQGRNANLSTILIGTGGTLQNGGILTATGLTLGVNGNGTLLIPSGASLTVNAGAGTVTIGDNGADGAVTVGILTATGSASVSISAANIDVGRGGSGNSGRGVITLGSGNNTFTATTRFRLGSSAGIGQASTDAPTIITFGSGNNTVTTPLFVVGEEKTNTRALIAQGGVLTLTNPGGMDLDIGNNSVSTGTDPLAIFDTTAGTLNATLDAVRVAMIEAGAGRTIGSWVLGTANNSVSLNSLLLGDPGTASTPANTNGVFSLNGGTVTFGTGGITDGGGSISHVNLNGGLLNMNGRDIGTSTNAINNFNFNGGTLLNAGQIFVTTGAGLTQSGGTLQRSVDGTTTINGAYTVAGPATVALGTSGGTSAIITAGSLARAGRGTIDLVPFSDSLGISQVFRFTTAPVETNGILDPWLVARMSSTDSSGDFAFYDDGSANSVRRFTGYTQGNLNSVAGPNVVYDNFNDGTQTITDDRTVYALRVSANIGEDSAGRTLSVNPTGAMAGVILNGSEVGVSNLNFGTSEALIYTSTGNGLISSNITGSNGLTKFGPGVLTLNSAAGSTYTGATNINGGSLKVSNLSGSATGTGAVNINNGGRLSGTGRIASATNNVAIAPGGIFAPGNEGSFGRLRINTTTGNLSTAASTTAPTAPTLPVAYTLTPTNVVGSAIHLYLGVPAAIGAANSGLSSNVVPETNASFFEFTSTSGVFTLNSITTVKLFGDSVNYMPETAYSYLVGTVPTGSTGSVTTLSNFDTAAFTNLQSASLVVNSGNVYLNFTTAAVPEPHHIMFISVAVLLMGLAIRRRLLTRTAVAV